VVKKFSEFVSEMLVRDSTGKLIPVKKSPIRMASGKIEMQYPGKSGSSGGGGNGQ
jgi:hypothetical protein